jgi:23S rRNA (uridine2552-2'-O)-methyltransferase
MARSKSSTRWLQEHFDDEYVKLSQKEGYRSRAVYKLKELQEKDRLIQHGMSVLDLGAAPGGWSQYAVELVGKNGRVVASDILPIDPLPFVEFIQGDFTEERILNEILDLIGNDKADVVISDMAPNLSGNDAVDQPSSIYLCELALDISKQILAENGTMVVKLFQGAGSDEYLKEVRQCFRQVKIRKPKASRARSREVYVVAQRYFHTN